MSSLQETIWENVSSQPLKNSLKGKFYRLKEWPNFGFSKYSPDFVVMSAHLTKKTMDKPELLSLVNNHEHLVNHFLNASSLLQILEVSEEREDGAAQNQSVVSKFTDRLRQIFSF